MKPLTVDEFRAEVQDKLGVVFNGCKSSPLERSCHRRQCEDFLVERYAEAVGDTLVSPAPETELQRAIARIVLKWSVSSRLETQSVLQELEALVPDSVWSGAGRKPEVVAPPPPAVDLEAIKGFIQKYRGTATDYGVSCEPDFTFAYHNLIALVAEIERLQALAPERNTK